MEQWGRELEVYSFEKFGEPSVLDVRNLILEYEKIHGHKPKHVVIDSLDLLYKIQVTEVRSITQKYRCRI